MNSPQVTTAKRLVFNTMTNIVMRLIGAVVSFLLIKFFLSAIGEERYGVWIVVGSIFSYRELMGMGLNSAVNRHVPICLAHNDDAGLTRVVSTALLFFVVLAMTLMVIALGIGWQLEHLLDLDRELLRTAKTLVLIVGIGYSLALPAKMYSAILSGLQRYDLMNLGEFIVLVVRTTLLVVFLINDFGLLAMGWISATAEVGVGLVHWLFVRRVLPSLSIRVASFDLKLLREMLGYGINALMYAMGAIIVYNAGEIIIGATLSASMVPRFFIATAMLTMLSSLVQVFFAAIKPAVSDMEAREEGPRIREVAFMSQKYTLLFLIPSVAFLVIMGRSFLSVWVGDEYPDAAVMSEMTAVLAILSVGHGLRLSQHSNYMVLLGRGLHTLFGVITIVGSLASVGLGVFSVAILDMGLIGIAWSCALPLGIASTVVLPVYFNRVMGVSFREALAHVWLPSVKGCMAAVLLLIVWDHRSAPDSWIEIFAVVISAALLTAVSSWLFSLTERERAVFAGFLRVRSG